MIRDFMLAASVVAIGTYVAIMGAVVTVGALR